jgi:superfamily II DNA or RNA helicase
MINLEINNTTGRVLNISSQELYNDFRLHFTEKAPGAEYLHQVKLRNTLRAIIKKGPMSGQAIRDLVYKMVPHDQPIRRRINTLSFRVEEERFHAGQIAGYLWEYDQENGSDGLVCMITEDHFFLAGLLPEIIKWAGEKGIEVNILDKRTKGEGEFFSQPTATLQGETAVSLRDYQQEVLNTCWRSVLADMPWYRGVIKVATGGGKTEIAVGLYQCNHLPTMFLVHRKDLLEQAARRFEKYGINCGRIGDNEFSPSYNTVTVATVQTLWSILKNEEDVRNGPLQTLFDGTQQIFFDEAHLMAADTDKANTFIKISKLFGAADIRWGLTATPFIKEDAFSNNLLMGATGGLLCDISNATLIDRGYLTPPRVKMVTVRHSQSYTDPITGDNRTQPTGRGTKWAEVYEYVITASPVRNRQIIEEIEAAPKPCLVLLQRKKHLEYLKAMGMSDYKVLTGSNSKQQRMQTVKELKEGKIDVVICTTIFDEGVDIPELRSVIMAGGGKSKIKTLQRLGRGLRLAEGKDEVLIVDFIDFNPATPGWTAGKHSNLRMKTYRKEGFKVE